MFVAKRLTVVAMKVLALVSGGKDSTFSLLKCLEHGHEIVALANLYKTAVEGKEDADSFCFQSVGQEIVPMIAECMELPLIRRYTNMEAKVTTMGYTRTEGDEVEDLYELVKAAKEQHPEIQAVNSGAIFSNYQRIRVENVCNRLGLVALGYLWRRDQSELLAEMKAADIHAILIKVASLGLSSERHLGRSVTSLADDFESMKDKYGLNVCGEGGEYETLTLDCPKLFKKRIVVDESHVHTVMNDGVSEVALFIVDKCHVEPKPKAVANTLAPEKVFSDPVGLPGFKKIGKHVHLSGIVQPGCADYAVETLTVMSQMKSRLEQLGASMEDVLFVHLFVGDISKFAQVNEVYKTFFDVNPPSRACVQVMFVRPDIHVMVDCCAQVGSGKRVGDDRVSLPRHVLHVQSISAWAPTCIGPYSQANVFGGLIFQAGQIGLVPSSMMLASGGLIPEAVQAFDNLRAVYEALKSDTKTTIACVIYLDHRHDSVPSRAFVLELAGSYLATRASVDVVIVPDLPKGAAIEVKVVGQTLESEKILQMEPLADHVDLADCVENIEVKGVFLKTAFLWSSFKLAVGQVSACDRPCIGQQLAQLTQILTQCTQVTGLGYDNLLHIRIFHPVSLDATTGMADSSSLWLLHRLRAFVSAFPVIPAVSFVGCHESQDYLLIQLAGRDMEAYHALHWLQDYPYEDDLKNIKFLPSPPPPPVAPGQNTYATAVVEELPMTIAPLMCGDGESSSDEDDD